VVWPRTGGNFVRNEARLRTDGSGRRLLVHVLHALAATGWVLHTSCDMTKKALDKDTLFFRACPPVQVCAHRDGTDEKRFFFSISFNETDKIRLIDSPNASTTHAFTSAVSVGDKPDKLTADVAAWHPGVAGERARLLATETPR
jgi:hypothetical protein